MTDQNLTHEELWDDSALVDSWNEAFDEYKKYHSLASRGEKVAPEPSNPTVKSKAAAHLAPNGTPNNITNAPANCIAPAPTVQSNSAPIIGPALPPTSSASNSAAPMPLGLAALPQTFLGSSQDENLKNIMMSWYYAGYYTGLYEGQQKAYVAMQESMQADAGE